MVALTELESDSEGVDIYPLVNVQPLFESPERLGLVWALIHDDLAVLSSIGWVSFWPPNQDDTMVIQEPGLQAARTYKALTRDHRRRAQEIRDATLNWLYDEHVSGGRIMGMSDFLKTENKHYLGDPYSSEELSRAMKWLFAEDYIDGFWAGSGELLRPIITTKGMRVIETEQSGNKALISAGVTVTEVNISGSSGVNVAIASNNVKQSNTLSQGQIEQVDRILGSVRAMLNPVVLGVTADVSTEASVLADQVEEEIRADAPDGGKVKAMLLKLVDLAATGTVQGGVDALNSMMQQGIAGIG